MIETNTDNINVDFVITEIYVKESLAELNLTNLVDKVIWKAVLSKNGVSSIAMGEVFLDAPETAEGFINIEEVSIQQVLAWVYAKLGGSVFIDTLKQNYAPIISKLEYESKLKKWTQPLVGQQVESLNILTQVEIDAMINSINNP